MAITATILASGRVFGAPAGPRDLALSWIISAGQDWHQKVDLITGDNTLFVPQGTTLIAIIPPTNNAQTIAAKGTPGSVDTGLTLSPTKPSLFSWNGTTAGFVLTVGGNVTVEYLCL